MTDRAEPTASQSPIQFSDVSTTSYDGTILLGRSWSIPNPKAILLIAHGLGEHGGSYERLAEELVKRLHVDVIAFDLRGSGRSPGKRGFVRSYDELTSDLDAAIGWMARNRPGLARFLFGHSNGGLVAILTVLNRKPDLAGLILSNPSLRLSARVPAWKRALGEALRKFAPGITLSTGLDNDQLTRDPEMIAAIDRDALRHGRISAPLFFGMLDAGPQALAHASAIQIPTLVILGESDPIIDPGSGRTFFENLGSADKTLRSFPGMRHEPLNEIGRLEVVSDLVKWLSDRIGRSEYQPRQV
ncbi:lysophospholipase [Tundrisphaera lichenicola]|uniref:alpha/beta hydrolase n=1 Tax=Tundrisphaera lichenicola TaxID=2029860 RepID=UPI003EBB283E